MFIDDGLHELSCLQESMSLWNLDCHLSIGFWNNVYDTNNMLYSILV